MLQQKEAKRKESTTRRHSDASVRGPALRHTDIVSTKFPMLKNSLLLRRRGPRRRRTRGVLLRRAHLPTRRCETIYATPATLLPEHVRTRTGLTLATRRVGRLR